MKILTKLTVLLFVATFLLAFLARDASAHCDTLNGPVVNAARKALEKENVNYAFIWIKKEKEDEVEDEFDEAIKNRKKGTPKDKDFFAAVVKAHREGEGETFDGIKSDDDVHPAIKAADIAVETGDMDKLLPLLKEDSYKKIKELFDHMQNLKNYNPDDVEKGREFVESYITYVHTIDASKLD